MTVKQAEEIVVQAFLVDYTFDHDHIKSVDIENTVSILGSELSYDTAEISVFSVDGYSYDDIRELPFGTPILIYGRDGETVEKYYIEKIKRPNRTTWTFSCLSAIGLLDRREHHGALYKGESLKEVIDEIIDDVFPHTYVNGFDEEKVFGWLPYANARDNLRQVLFTYNAHIDKDSNGDVVFTRMDTRGSDPILLDSRRVYLEGEEETQTPATKIIVTEHDYDYNTYLLHMFTAPYMKEDFVTLFDNSEGLMAQDKLIKFSEAPVWKDSIQADEESGSRFMITERGENYAIVSGRGKLIGVPYNHTTREIERNLDPYDLGSELIEENIEHNTEVVGAENTVSVTDVTLINILNGETIADRLVEYYSVKQKLSGNFVFNGETPGKRYSFVNTFGEQFIGYLTRCSRSFTSRYMAKASGDFIANYYGNYFGNNYKNYKVLTGDAPWYPLSEGITRFTAILIGGGDGGDSGLAGQSSSDTRGGTGGSGGSDGKGGRIYMVTIDDPASMYIYSCGSGGQGGSICVSSDEDLRNKGNPGQNTTLEELGTATIYTTQYGYQSQHGFLNPLSGVRYGYSYGREGYHGGDGGTATSDWSEDGKHSYFGGFPDNKYHIGAKAAWSNEHNSQNQIMYAVDPMDSNSPPRSYGRVTGGGGGGGGSETIPTTVETDATNGVAPWITTVSHEDDSNSYVEYQLQPGAGGNGGNGLNGLLAERYGCGGQGGGGGGGAGGLGVVTTDDYTYEENVVIVVEEGDPEEETEAVTETKKVTKGGKSTKIENPAYGKVYLYDTTTGASEIMTAIKNANPDNPSIARSWDGDTLNFNGISYTFDIYWYEKDIEVTVGEETQTQKERHYYLRSVRAINTHQHPMPGLGSSCKIKERFNITHPVMLTGCPKDISSDRKVTLYAYRNVSPYYYEDHGDGVGIPAGDYEWFEIGFSSSYPEFNNTYFNIELNGCALGGYGGAGGNGYDGCIIVFY